MAITNIAIACQGGGSHAAYSAGVLPVLLPDFANAALAAEPGARQAAGDGDVLKLVGISGTSGGAITALLAWYGFITGGPQAAQHKLEAFWDANSTQWIGEEIWNACAQQWANSLSYDLKFSPYLPPLREAEVLATKVWPSLAGALGGFNRWIRGEFFQLAELIRPHVDFHLIAALGAFCSIAHDVERWRALDLETRMVAAGSARRHELDLARQLIEQGIVRKLAGERRLQQAMDASGVAPDALLRQAFGRWRQPDYAFEAAPLAGLAGAVLEVTSVLPQLLVGAVQIDNGQFTAFSSERPPDDGGISLDAVLASAALPWLFEAQRLCQRDPERNVEEVHAYWDGLFSQNPPIKNFMSGVIDQAKKPDGIWIVQINPNDFHIEAVRRRASADALSGNEIWHTRDALAGNLSLNQEVAFVEAINRRIDDGGAGAPLDKHIKVDRIVMDAGAVESVLPHKLGVASKFDRSARLKDALVVHGRMQAERFLDLRKHVEQVSGNLGALLQQLSAPGTPDLLAGAAPEIAAEQGVREAQLVVDGLTVHHAPAGNGAAQALASVHWHTRGARLDGSQVRIEGDSGLFSEGGAENWRLCEVCVAGIAPG
jgi:predicted acylesterase/phospholipase RssA